LKGYTALLSQPQEATMPKVVPIVEGNGEVDAVPLLLRKLLGEMHRWDVQPARPLNAHGRGNLEKLGGLEKFIRLALKESDCAEGDCAKELAKECAECVRAVGVTVPMVIVCAKCEYEAWFLASPETIAGKDLKGRPGLPAGIRFAGDTESIQAVKGWLTRHLPKGRAYKETLDQAPMTDLLDTELTKQRSRSFRRLWHAVEQMMEAFDKGEVVVTP
jgi:hypothetical protein